MSIILQKDIFKKQISRKQGIALMLFVSLILLITIIANFIWMLNYDIESIKKNVSKNVSNPTVRDLNVYVKFRALMSIFGNLIVLGFFNGLIWWSISKKRFGWLFPVFWLLIFLSNAVSYPFYNMQLNAISIIIIIFNALVSIYLIIYLAEILKDNSRIRQEIARKAR